MTHLRPDLPIPQPETLGPTRLSFADARDIDSFVEALSRFERGELGADEWKRFRMVNGIYGQRQEGDLTMVRAKIPQGVLTPGRLRAAAEVAERFADGRAHLTTRQNFQFHFVHLRDAEAVLRRLAEAGMTTREACGNAVRNVTTCPFAGASAVEPFDPTPWAEAVTRGLLRGPLSSSLPRKFKIAFGGCCGHDCVGAAFNDLGFLARSQGGRPGFKVTLGGGLATLRRSGLVAHEFLPADEVLEAATAVVRLFHRTGDRKRRDKARLKYVVAALGPERFLAEYQAELAALRAEERQLVQPLPAAPGRTARSPEPRPARPGQGPFLASNVRHLGGAQTTVSVRVPLGDLSAAQLRALALAAEQFSEEGEARTTIDQDVVLRFVHREHLASLHALLDGAGLAAPGAHSVADVTSCPGASSCRLAVTASRGLASLLESTFEAEPGLAPLAPDLSIKISGCPNGCGQHHVAGLGLQGSVRKLGTRAVPQYFVYLGGSPGDGVGEARFGRLAARLPARRVPEAVRRLLGLYQAEKQPGETPDRFLARLEADRVGALLADLETLGEAEATADDFVDLDEASPLAHTPPEQAA